MSLLAGRAVAALWALFALAWLVAAPAAKRTLWRETIRSGLTHRLPLFATFVLLWLRRSLPALLRLRLLPHATALDALAVALTAAGVLFALWARFHLGRNWSAAVTVKENHALVTSGPYRFVRHPIYTGMLLAILGTAIATAELRGLLALLLAFAAFLHKSRLEEARMRATFPEYARYAEGTKGIIPYTL